MAASQSEPGVAPAAGHEDHHAAAMELAARDIEDKLAPAQDVDAAAPDTKVAISRRKRRVGKKTKGLSKRDSVLIAREMAWDPSVALSNAQTEAFAAEANLHSLKKLAQRKPARLREVSSAASLPARLSTASRPSTALRELQDEITKRILEREARIEEARAVAVQKPLDTGQLLAALADIREHTMRVAQEIVAWRDANHGFNRTFLWKGHNYLLTMVADLNFLARDPEIPRALGIGPEQLENNPLMAPTPLLAPVRSPQKSQKKSASRKKKSVNAAAKDEQVATENDPPLRERQHNENLDGSADSNDASSASGPEAKSEEADAASSATTQPDDDEARPDQEAETEPASASRQGQDEPPPVETMSPEVQAIELVFKQELAEANSQLEERKRRTRSPTMGISQEPSFTTSADVLERWRATAEEQVRALSTSWGLDEAAPGKPSRARDKKHPRKKPSPQTSPAPAQLKSRPIGRSMVDLDPSSIYRGRASTAATHALRRKAGLRRRPRTSVSGARRGKSVLPRSKTRLAPLSAAGLADVVHVPLPSYAFTEGSIGLLSMRTSELGAPSLRLDVRELQAVLEEEAPSSEVRLCLTAVLILVAPGRAVPADLSFKSIRETLLEKGPVVGARTLMDAACRVTASSVPKFKVLALADFLGDARFQPEQVLARNPESVAALCAWVINLVTGSPRSRRWIASHLEASRGDQQKPDAAQTQHEGDGDAAVPTKPEAKSEVVDNGEVAIDPASVSIGELIVMTNLSRGGAVYALTFFRTKSPARSLLVKCYEPESGEEAALVVSARQMSQLSTKPRTAADWQQLCKTLQSHLEVRTRPQLALRYASAEDGAQELRKAYGTARAYGPHKFSISVFCYEGDEDQILLRVAGARGAEAGLRFEKTISRKRVASLLYERKRLVAQEPLYASSVVERILDHLVVTDKGISFVRGRPPPKPELKEYRSVMDQDPTRVSKEELADLERAIREKEHLVLPQKSVVVKPANFIPRCALDPPKHSVPKYEPPPKPVYKIRKPCVRKPLTTKPAEERPKAYSATSSTRPVTRASPSGAVSANPAARVVDKAKPAIPEPARAESRDAAPALEPPRPRTADPGEFDRRPTPKELQDDSTYSSSSSDDDYEDFDDENDGSGADNEPKRATTTSTLAQETSPEPAAATKADDESDEYSNDDDDDDFEDDEDDSGAEGESARESAQHKAAEAGSSGEAASERTKASSAKGPEKNDSDDSEDEEEDSDFSSEDDIEDGDFEDETEKSPPASSGPAAALAVDTSTTKIPSLDLSSDSDSDSDSDDYDDDFMSPPPK